jgi:hypothetical protein
MQEQWTRWEPVAGLAEKYYVESISESAKGFKLILSEQFNEKNEVHISFKRVYSYKHTNESFRYKTIDMLNEMYGVAFYANWTFFKIADSEYVKWLSEESHDTSDIYKFVHFSLIAADSILDIIATREPEVTFHTNRSE